ncbi:MAG: hypothetical protein RL662_1927 [Bacteroidota bacterium]|jgi:hypothetical protein
MKYRQVLYISTLYAHFAFCLFVLLVFRGVNSIKSFYTSKKNYFDFDLHSFKLKETSSYHWINALLNSQLINYYIDLFLRKRISGSYPKIGNEDILNIPIPKDIDEEAINQISIMSKEISDGVYDYEDKKFEINELFFDLYELSYLEKLRIKDYFILHLKKKMGRDKNTRLDNYKEVIIDIISPYLNNLISIDFTSTDFDLVVAKISLNEGSKTPSSDRFKKYALNEIFEQNPNENFLTGQEKIFGKDCVYIVKKDTNQNWTGTKAFEDGQEILKHLISYKNGERIHQS